MRIGPLSMALVLALAAGCRDEVEVRLSSGAFARDDVMLEVEELFALDDTGIAARTAQGDVDGRAVVDERVCGGPCRALLLTLLLRNQTAERTAPPVVRLSSPAGRPARVPVAFSGQEISPGRTGRIRFLVALYPEEKALDVWLSGSVFFEVLSAARDVVDTPP